MQVSGSSLVALSEYFAAPLVTVMLIGLFIDDIWGSSWISWVGTWSRIGGWFEPFSAFLIDVLFWLLDAIYELRGENFYGDVAPNAMAGFYVKLVTWIGMRVVVWTAYDDWVSYVEYQNWLGGATEEQLELQQALLNPDFAIKGDSSEGTEQDVEEEFDATF